jgi:hypothetical protein
MEGWKEFILELAKKLAPILAFAVLIIIVVAAFGVSIPPVFQALIYIVVIGGMVIYAFQVILGANARRKLTEDVRPPAAENVLTGQKEPKRKLSLLFSQLQLPTKHLGRSSNRSCLRKRPESVTWRPSWPIAGRCAYRGWMNRRLIPAGAD